MDRARPAGYSFLQIVLHWTVVVLVIFQFLASDGMNRAWRAFERGTGPVSPGDLLFANFHMIAGLTILVLATWRVGLRLKRGAPPPPEHELPALKFVANATHGLLYLMLFVLPVSGSMAWLLGVAVAGEVHQFAKTLLLVVAILHALAALAQHFVMRTDVLRRMLVPARH